ENVRRRMRTPVVAKVSLRFKAAKIEGRSLRSAQTPVSPPELDCRGSFSLWPLGRVPTGSPRARMVFADSRLGVTRLGSNPRGPPAKAFSSLVDRPLWMSEAPTRPILKGLAPTF